MPFYKAPLEDFKFLYHEFLDLEECRELPSMAEATPDVIDAVLEEAARISTEVLLPLNEVGDREGCTFDAGKVTTPTGFNDAYRIYTEGGWTGLTTDPEYGGQGLPSFVGLGLSENVNAIVPLEP